MFNALLQDFMIDRSLLRNKIFEVDEHSFNSTALEIFHFQYENNSVFRQFCSLLHKSPAVISTIDQIPFLPIELFKTHEIVSGHAKIQKVFTSSGTTGQQTSRHYVSDLTLYEESFLKCFQQFYGDPEKYCVLALLPSYLERDDSSLVYMAEHLIRKSGHSKSGFFLYNHEELHQTLLKLEAAQQPILLIGVTFALLDFSEKFSPQLKFTRVIETGGMKGRREEITREALHERLRNAFGIKIIYSEYGMTELLSQAYFMDDEKFHSPNWMKVLIRDVNDPFQLVGPNKTGAINIIDLANIDSCSFIATADLGKSFDDQSFEVLGRMDDSDVRGCNLMWGD